MSIRTMLSTFLPAAIFLFSGVLIFAQELAEEEIRGAEEADISFENYEGPHEKIESAEDIRGIGSTLSLQQEGDSAEGRAEYFNKYRVNRIAPEPDAELFGADIFTIEEGATVDHIDNVRRILAGYVENNLGYSAEEADTIATFLTLYNAVHRQDMEYIGSTYNKDVADAINPEKAGLATSYRQWPGNTQMLIPLRTIGEETALSTDTVGEEEVVEKMREEEEDRGVEDRKDMVEIRDKELEEEEEKTEEKKEQLEEKTEEVEEKEEKLAEAEKELEEVQQEEGPESSEAQEAEEEIEEQKKELEEAEKETEELEEEIEKEEKEQEERRESIQEEREKIAEDQREVMEDEQMEEEEEPLEAVESSTFIIFEDEEPPLGRLVKINKKNGEILKRGVNTVRSKQFAKGGKGIILIAGEDDSPRAVRLVEVDMDSLEILGKSDTDIYPQSSLTERNGDIYVVTKKGEEWRVGRFSTDGLTMSARSEEDVAPQTMFLFENGSLFVQGGGGRIIRLDPASLKNK